MNSDEPEGWAEFWESYPRHQARLDGLKAWRKLNPNPELRVEMIAALRAQLPELLSRPPDKRPLPATWIRGERWTDETIAGLKSSPAGRRAKAEDFRRTVWAMRCRHDPKCESYPQCIDLLADEDL